MPLNSDQIKEIETYINSFNIKYYEIYMEILDHMILSVETILIENKCISFEDAVVKAKAEGFGKKGFREIMNEKVKLAQKQARKYNSNQIKEYFSFPKIALTIGVFLGYFLAMLFFKEPRKLYVNATGLLVLIGAFQFIYFRKYTKLNKLYILKTHLLNLGLSFVFAIFQLSNSLLILGKDTLDFNHVLIRLFMAFVFTLSFISLLVYIEIRKKTIEELKKQVFI